MSTQAQKYKSRNMHSEDAIQLACPRIFFVHLKTLSSYGGDAGRSESSLGANAIMTCLRPYADSEGPDQHAYPSLIKTLAVRKQNHLVL